MSTSEMKEIIGQHLIMGLAGHALTSEEKKFLVENNIGGVILFARNVSSPEQVHALSEELFSLSKQTASKQPFFVSVDQEGGRVARLRAPLTVWPPLRKVGDLDSPSMAFQFSMAMGSELAALGFNLDFAPCLDIFSNPKNTVIGDRSLGIEPEIVSKLASALVRGYIKAGIIPCAKHFPGHGGTLIDSHEDLPVEEATLERLMSFEILPFKKAFKSHCDLVMSAHIRFTNVDAKYPATLSEIFLKKILRDELRYRGLIITDDLDMGALAKHFAKNEIPVRALEAGADLLLYCNDPQSPIVAVEAIEKAIHDKRLSRNEVERSTQAILKFKSEKLQNYTVKPFAQIRHLIAHPDHVKLSQAIAEGRVLAEAKLEV